MQHEVELLMRLVAAAVFTGAIGWERETAHKSAGLRTHLLVKDNRPQGLTTAASIWAASGVGMGTGFGKYVLAGGPTLMLPFVLRVVEIFERRYLAGRTRDTLNPER